jgi:hypothetical protein
VERQLIDGDEYVFHAYPYEPVYSLLEEGEVDADALRARVEEELRRLRPTAVGDTGYHHKELDVLGERVKIDVRNPANRPLVRTVRLYEAVRDATGPLRVVTVGELPPRAHDLAVVLREHPDGIPAAQLQERLVAHVTALADSLDSDDVRGRARALEDPRAVFALVSELRDLGLAEETADGIVRATEKLRVIRL